MINVIEPNLIKTGVKAFFTQKNEQFSQKDSRISGLNLGFNTPDAKETVLNNRKYLFQSYENINYWIEWFFRKYLISRS